MIQEKILDEKNKKKSPKEKKKILILNDLAVSNMIPQYQSNIVTSITFGSTKYEDDQNLKARKRKHAAYFYHYMRGQELKNNNKKTLCPLNKNN